MTTPTAIHSSLLEGLGWVVHRWAYVEGLEEQFLKYLIESTGANIYVITQSVSGKSLTSWLRTLSELKFTHKESSEKLRDLFTRIDDTRAERNALVHGLWSPGSEPMTAMVQTINLARSAIIVSQLVTRPDLDELVDRIGEIMGELILIGRNLGWHGPASEVTSR